MKLVNLKIKNKAVKISWVRILDTEPNYSEIVYVIVAPEMKKDIWRCSLERDDIKYLGIKKQFLETGLVCLVGVQLRK